MPDIACAVDGSLYVLDANGSHQQLLTRQMLGCVPRDGGPVQNITSVPFTTTGNTFSEAWDYNFWAGFMPDDTPMLLKDVGHAELYALSINWK